LAVAAQGGGQGFGMTRIGWPLWIIIGAATLVLLALLGWRAATPSACERAVHDQSLSPDGTRMAYVHGPGCGGAGEYVVRVTLAPAGSELESHREDWVFSTRDVRIGEPLKSVKARWAGDDIAVVYDERLEVSGKSHPGVHVRYEPVAPGALDGLRAAP